MAYLLWTVIGYLMGSIPSGYLVFKIVHGDDIRKFGSGNIGATNVNRTLGIKWAVLVAFFDMFKGGAVLIVAFAAGINEPWLTGLTGLAAVCGHNFPIWLGFRGGKGVSTTFGVVIFFSPPLSFFVAALGGLVWFIFLKFTRYVSVASLIALFSLPCFFILTGEDHAFAIISFLLAVLSCYRHRSNISRLIEGKESRTGHN
jgi:glycerol-3-phosphate acyltransferase PlsY